MPLEFVIEDAKGKRSTVEAQADVQSARLAMKLRTRLAQKGRKPKSHPGTVNLPVARASTVTFASLAEMDAVQKRFESDDSRAHLRHREHAAARRVRGADGGARRADTAR